MSIRIQNASRIGQALLAFRRTALTPLPEFQVRCVLNGTGVQDLLQRRLRGEINPENLVKGCQSEPAHWESPGDVKGLRSRNSWRFLTPRHSRDYNTPTS